MVEKWAFENLYETLGSFPVWYFITMTGAFTYFNGTLMGANGSVRYDTGNIVSLIM